MMYHFNKVALGPKHVTPVCG